MTVDATRRGPALRLGDIPLLEVGLRPFFLAGAAWAVIALVLWLAALGGHLDLGGAYGPVTWHAHEMVYGFAGAILAGFLLTAVPTWTGGPGLSGTGLGALVLLWIAARAAMAGGFPGSPTVAAALDLSFFALLFGITLRQVLAGRNWRNLPVAVAPGLLLTGSGLVHAEGLGLADTAALGNRLGIAVFVLLVVLIGGRIIPAFTRNWLRNTKPEGPMPVQPNRFDLAVVLLTLLALGAWLAAPGSPILAAAAAAAALAHAVRLSRWCGWRTAREPLVWILHVAYAWVPVGFAMAALSARRPEIVPESAALHALTAGVIACMMLAMMTRAALGHTGRPLKADAATLLVYVLGLAAAGSRVAAPLVTPETYLSLVGASGILWVAAFGLYLAIYGPRLCRPRIAPE